MTNSGHWTLPGSRRNWTEPTKPEGSGGHRMFRKASAALVGLLVAATGLVAVVTAPAARATVRGSNGKIVFARYTGNPSQIFTVNPDGTGLTQLTNDPGDGASWPAWSPDGTKIAFASHRSPDGIYIMDADGANAHRIAPWAGFISWSG